MNDKDLIVVGVDGSDGGRRALRWAIREAARSGGTVRAITAWTLDGGMVAVTTAREQQQWAEEMSAREVGAAATETGASIAREVVEGFPVTILIDASRTARMLVLGGHGYGRLHHAVLGSTSEECIRRAVCPVVIVPATVSAPVPTA